MNGIINIYKEKGFTSHDVVAIVRKTLNEKKVGHTGTLDPQAEGVLPVCIGKGTKVADYIMAERKSYKSILKLGITTTTEDATGEVVEEKKVIFDENKITEAVNSFKGEYFQVPPMYSAIKVNGKKLYELAREGKEIERKARKITIFDIRIVRFLPPDSIEIEVDCSKGTYIRTLCADIGSKLACGAHMSTLLRTASGEFKLNSAVTISRLKELAQQNLVKEILLPIDTALKQYNKVFIAQKAAKLLYNGCKIYNYFFESVQRDIILGEKILAYDSNGSFIGIYEAQQDKENDRLCIKPLKLMI